MTYRGYLISEDEHDGGYTIIALRGSEHEGSSLDCQYVPTIDEAKDLIDGE